MFEAARVDDKLYHSSALAGFIIGSIIGAAVIFAAAAYAASIVLTGGATLVATGFIVGMGVTTLGVVAGGLIRSVGEKIGSMCHHDVGQITTGSKNVKVNSKRAAHVELSTVACKDDSAIQRMAEGSSNIFINSKAAVRLEDKTTCDAVVDSASSNVTFGGGRVQYLDIKREISDEMRDLSEKLFIVAGLAGGIFGAAKQAGCFGLKCLSKIALGEMAGAAAGYGLEKGVGAIAGYFGYPVDVISGQKLLTGEGDDTDFILPGIFPLHWSRIYRSENHHVGALGQGWSLVWERSLRKEDDSIVYQNDEGREIVFPLIKRGERYFSPTEHIWLARTERDTYAISSPFETCFIFEAFSEAGVAKLASLEDLNGHALYFSYDDIGQLKKISTTSGYGVYCQYEKGRLVSVACVKGGTPGTLVRYQYNEQHQLVSVTNREGQITRQFGYHGHLINKLADVRGLECRYTWADIGGTPRITHSATNLGEQWQFDYDIDNQQTTLTDLNTGQTACWGYNAQHLITDYRDFDGGKYAFDYNDLNMPVRVVLAGERTLVLAYDALARPIQITDPLKREIHIDYHRNSLRVVRRQYPDGQVWKGEYDRTGRLLKENAPDGGVTRYHYPGASSLPERITNAVGAQTHLGWERHGQLTEHTDCSGKLTRYEYDIDGHLLTVIDAENHSTHYSYNRLGQPTGVRYADGRKEQLRYNAQGLVEQFTDPVGRQLHWRYNLRGQPVSFTDRLQREYRYRYDCHGQMIELDNANGGQYHFRWSSGGQLVEEQYPDNLVRRYRYGESGMLMALETTAPTVDDLTVSRQVSFDYDAGGRMTQRLTGMSATRYDWDIMDRLLLAERVPTAVGEQAGIVGNGVRLAYDKAGHLLTESGDLGAVTYQWDPLHHLAALTLPDGQTLSWLRYGAGHVSAIRHGDTLISEFSRDNLHREVSRTQGILTQYRDYDAMGRRLWQSAGSDAPTVAADLLPRQGDIWRKFSFDTAGELSMATDFIRGEQQYRYDAEGRLTDSRERHQLSVAEDFAYDNADNLLNLRKLPFDTVDPLYDTPVANNRLTQWQHYRFEYDAWGNMTTRHAGGRMQHFAYDDDNRLLRAWGTGPLGEHDSHYRYDALGRRIHKSVTIKRGAEKTTRQTDFIWQGLRLLQEQHADGNATYIYDPNESYTPLARVDQRHGETESQVYYFHTDINGTPLDVTDGEGKHRWSGKYHAWGKVTRQNVSDPRQSTVSRFAQPLRYPGQYSDDETGLHYNTFRYYDPEIGRFSTQDPIGLAGGINLYQYGPNPLGWVDPLGWMPWAWNPNGMGHHLIPRNKANSIGLTELGTKLNTPTFFPDPYQAGMHEELHRAIKNDIGKIQGPWKGSAADLFEATGRNLDSVSHIRGDLRIPSTGEVIARNVTPKEAHSRLTEWFNNKKSGGGGGC
ncbi:PAAR/RHS domain-containing protein [Yersinia pseudotuberculosis]|uniref:PAAR/RHS domain-containing protein n=1 Tax=Yersinia pseudotuberculosis TaxID=633 RepID=UPI0005E55D59|nr:PAAR/RHS domain-containing protein [Yersinia pseudotuberculosis]CNI48561.1 RHS/YD repeat-containing protein [Yersinia pseudotuberculosis]